MPIPDPAIDPRLLGSTRDTIGRLLAGSLGIIAILTFVRLLIRLTS